jgi:hypothetical protein
LASLRRRFVLDAGMLVSGYLEADEPATVVEMHRDLAVYLGRHAERNNDALSARLRWFNVALAGFVLEVMAIMVVLLDVA